MNINAAEIAFSWLAGVVLAGIYFGGLWLTVKHLSERKQPWLWLMASFAIRAPLAICVFYFVLMGPPSSTLSRLLAAIIGFLSVRVVMIWTLGPRPVTRSSNQANNASNG
ncbi:MAG: ATP synthase subunit I [Gemmataceae bacterium]